jgi:hypothetical protein
MVTIMAQTNLTKVRKVEAAIEHCVKIHLLCGTTTDPTLGTAKAVCIKFALTASIFETGRETINLVSAIPCLKLVSK